MTAYKWSKTAASNGNIDSTINAREGMAPSQINDSLRAIMAALAKWRDDLSGNLVTGGTSTAYTLTTNQVFDSLSDGLSILARLNATSGASPTLNVDGLGAKAIAGSYGAAVATGALVSGGVYRFTYDSSDDKWIAGNAPLENPEGQLIAPTGTLMLFQQTNAPTGWTKQTTHNNKALRVVSGTASSGGTTGFSDVFTSRTIAQANLPNVTLTVTGTVSTSPSSPSPAYVGNSQSTTTASGASSFPIGVSTLQLTSSFSNGATSSINGGVTQTAIDFAVSYVDLIIAEKD